MAMKLRGNALAGTAEQVVVGIAYFVSYGVLIRFAGADAVGVLSLVLILASIGSMTGTGFASALAHFVPLFESSGDRESTVKCIDTTLACTSVLYIATIGLAYLPLTALIAAQAGPANEALVRQLMIPAALHVVFLGVGSTTSIALTALQRSDARLMATIAGVAAGLVVLIAGVSEYGVVAGLWAMAVQSAVIGLAGWVYLAFLLPEVGPLPRHFEVAMARRLLGLGTNLQIQTILVAAIEPVTRLLIGQYGSLAAVAYFSMASRYVIQVRALIFSGAQPLLSAFSHARLAGGKEWAELYGRARSTLNFLAIVLLSGAAGAAPFVAEVWTGSLERSFVLFTAALAFGWAVNTIALTSYFNAYSLGKMNRSLVGHALLVGLTAALGFPLAAFMGASGAVWGLSLALVLSGVFLLAANGHYAPADAPRPALARDALLAILATAGAALAIAVYFWLREGQAPLVAGLGSGLAWLLVVAPAALAHPTLRPYLRRKSPRV